MIPVSIYWFRNNCRLRDLPSLQRCKEDSQNILPVWIYEDRWDGDDDLGFPVMGDLRYTHLRDSALSLQKRLHAMGSELLILRGDPTQILLSLSQRLGGCPIYTSLEVAYYERQQEIALAKSCELVMVNDQSLYGEDDLPFDYGDVPRVFTDFRKKVEKYSSVRSEVQEITSLPPAPDHDYTSWEYPARQVSQDHRSAVTLEGDETAAWNRVQHYFYDTQALSVYKKTRNALIGSMYSSKLSPYLAVGSLSAVSIYHEIKRYEKQHGSNESTYWLFFELLWREFFRWVARRYGAKIFHISGIMDRYREYSGGRKEFQKWIDGKTGDAFVDANMRELAATGFMSNRGRQNVASYLVHHMRVPWTWGARYFESQLIDYDASSNWCNWMYQSGVGNDPRDRVFNTKRQAEMYDKDGSYRDLWS